jgi:hypothetical protein
MNANYFSVRHRYKPVIIVCLILTALAYSGLLIVPGTRRLSPRPPQLLFTCNKDAGAIVAERCSDAKCSQRNDTRVIEYAVRGCQVRCPSSPSLSSSRNDKGFDAMALVLSSAPRDDGGSGFKSQAGVAPHMCLVDANARVST